MPAFAGARRALHARPRPVAPVPGLIATGFATAPAVHFHPHGQAASVTRSGGQIVACPDLAGLAALSGYAADGTTVVGPYELTDGLGRRFWRFNGAQYATLANTLNALANRQYAVAMVVRCPHGNQSIGFLNPRFASYTSDSSNTAANASIGLLRSVSTSNSAAYLGSNSSAVGNATDAYKVIPGAQMQVIGVASRTTANGGLRFYLNNDKCDVAQNATSVTGYLGAIVGGKAGASNTAAVSTGTGADNVFDLYELAIWRGELTNAQSDAAIAGLVANYAIPQLDSQLVLEGDSITFGIATALTPSPANSTSLAHFLTEPGTELIPANVRVVNMGVSGSTTTTATARRDATNGWPTALYPGGAARNVMTVQLGRNDMGESIGQKNSATFYADMVAYLSAATTGILPRGWKAYVVANAAGSAAGVTTNVSPAGENTLQKRIEGFRAKIAVEASHTPQPQLLSDCAAAAGQAYDGLLGVLHLYDISTGGQKWFYDAIGSGDWANATPPGPYDTDSTHLVEAGHALMASGGDTPQYGFGSIL